MLLWLWCRPVDTALIRPLAWEPPYATGAAIEKAKRQKDKKKKKITKWEFHPVKKLLCSEGNPQKTKKQPTEWETFFQSIHPIIG